MFDVSFRFRFAYDLCYAQMLLEDLSKVVDVDSALKVDFDRFEELFRVFGFESFA